MFKPKTPLACATRIRSRLAETVVAVLCGTALLVSAGAVSAMEDEAEDVEYSREGPYLGFLGFGLIEDARGSLDVDDSGGIGASIGFRMVPELALEIFGDWARLGGANPWSLGVNAKIYVLPFFEASLLGDRLQPYVIGTVGITTGELGKDNQPGGNYRIGVGTDYWLNESLAITSHVQYSGNGGDASNLRNTNISLGVIWRFGGSGD